MVATIILDLILFYIVGWIVHFVMGPDGGPLHYCFIGGAGAGLGAFLEWVTKSSTGTFWGIMLRWILCAAIVEWTVRKVKIKVMK